MLDCDRLTIDRRVEKAYGRHCMAARSARSSKRHLTQTAVAISIIPAVKDRTWPLIAVQLRADETDHPDQHCGTRERTERLWSDGDHQGDQY